MFPVAVLACEFCGSRGAKYNLYNGETILRQHCEFVFCLSGNAIPICGLDIRWTETDRPSKLRRAADNRSLSRSLVNSAHFWFLVFVGCPPKYSSRVGRELDGYGVLRWSMKKCIALNILLLRGVQQSLKCNIQRGGFGCRLCPTKPIYALTNFNRATMERLADQCVVAIPLPICDAQLILDRGNGLPIPTSKSDALLIS